jgi:hypothetical protein
MISDGKFLLELAVLREPWGLPDNLKQEHQGFGSGPAGFIRR